MLDNTIENVPLMDLVLDHSSIISIAHEDNMFQKKVSGRSRTVIEDNHLHAWFAFSIEGWCQIID